MFDLYFRDAESTLPTRYPSNQILDFVAEEMLRYGEKGIVLDRDDIKLAIDGGLPALSELCTGRRDTDGEEIDLPQGSEDTGCMGLRHAILSLVQSEQEAQQLADDLLMAANGAELSMNNEPHRPIDMGTTSFLLKRVWSGTGVGLIPWDEDHDAAFEELGTAIDALTSDELDQAVLRFHHGYFRDKRENDVRFRGVGTDNDNCTRTITSPAFPEITPAVAVALCKLSKALEISGDPLLVGQFVTPRLERENVAFWARKDDLGLQFVYPSRFFRLILPRAGTYPVRALEDDEGGDVLAYPFFYSGAVLSLAAREHVHSPLCSRTVGRYGYLCRRPEVPSEECENPSPDTISLVECSLIRTETGNGPNVCSGIRNVYADDGQSITDPSNAGRLNPRLTKADTTDVCSPETQVFYQDDISSHACYIGLCLAQSMRGQSLVPSRNPVLANESTSPFLACSRPDPQLGLYQEAAYKSPFPLPDYVGHRLVQDFDRELCIKNGDAARSLAGDCRFNSEVIARAPSYEQAMVTDSIVVESAAVTKNQDDFLSIASVIGQRAALDQTLLLERKLFAAMGDFVRQMASLLGELRRAPITTVACPVTGPFQTYGI